MDSFSQNDHDLLIVISSQMVDMRRELKELKDGTVSRISVLEKVKADSAVVDAIQKRLNDDLEIRVRVLENQGNLQTGKGVGYQFSWALVFQITTILVAILAIVAGIIYGTRILN